MAMQRWQKLFTELFQQSPLAKNVRDMQTLANFLCVFYYFENVVVGSSVYEACTTEGKLSYHSFFTRCVFQIVIFVRRVSLKKLFFYL